MGRKDEAKLIRRANRAAAVGRLMLRQLSSWHEFLEVDTLDFESLPRRQLKSGAADVKKRVGKEIKRFCSTNFENMTEPKLSQLYEELKAHRGFEMPLKEFEAKYSKVQPKVIEGFPPHCTVSFSLWGFGIKFPEDELSKDIFEAITTVHKADSDHKKLMHGHDKREKFARLERKRDHAARSCLLCCFNLVEAFLNGIAWDFAQNQEALSVLSKRQQNLIQDQGHTSLREKIIKYPSIVTGRHLWDESNETVQAFLDILKPFRDSLVHPSPFSAPEKFGGYDKLKTFYRVGFLTAHLAVKVTADLIVEIHRHQTESRHGHPVWLDQIMKFLDETISEEEDT